jgi:hypothetical protein
MTELPDTLEAAIAQAQTATQAALQAGYTRLSVELLFPELKVMPVAQQFVPMFEAMGQGVKVFFADAGTAAWAKQNWPGASYQFGSLDVAGSRQTTSVEEQIGTDDRIYVFVAPTAVEVGPVEQIFEAAGERPSILLNPRLEDVATIGIGYAGRQLRQRFLNTIEPCYLLRPLGDNLVLLRLYPHPWQVWLEQEGTWQVIGESQEKPDSQAIAAMVTAATGITQNQGGLFAGLGAFLRALSR